MKQTFTLDSCGDIDQGALRIAFNNALKLLTQDLADRPMLDKSRVALLEIKLKPVVDVNSSTPHLESSDVAWQVSTKTPAVGSANVVMKPQQDGQLYFHSDLPQDPDDETIMDEAQRRREERGDRRGHGAGE